MKTCTIITGLLLTLMLSVGALADFTVNKTMYEAFQMYNSDGSPRTNCNDGFTAKVKVGKNYVSYAWTFSNDSTGDYTASCLPNRTGFYKIFIFHHNTSIGMPFTETVRNDDVDIVSGQVAAIPTNPLLASGYIAPDNAGFHNFTSAHHSQLAYLDATISSRSTYSGGAVASVTAPVTVGTNNDKSGYSLTSAYDAAKTAMQAASYVAPDNASIATIKASTNNLPTQPAAVGSAMTLTTAYDAAKTAASQVTVNNIPTNPLLTSDSRLNNLDAAVSSRLASSSYTSPPTVSQIDTQLSGTHGGATWGQGVSYANYTGYWKQSAKQSTLLAIQSAVGTPFQASNYVAPLDATSTASAVWSAVMANYLTTGSVGAKLNAAANAGDPWATQLPGAYAPGTAGEIIGSHTDPWLATLPGSYTTGSAGYKLGTLTSGGGSSSAIAILPFQGTNAYTGPISSGVPISINSGDDVTLLYAIFDQSTMSQMAKKPPLDLTGYTVKMAVVRHIGDTNYVIAPRDVTSGVTLPKTLGTGMFTLSHADTATLSGVYAVGLTIYGPSGTQNQALSWELTVHPSVIH